MCLSNIVTHSERISHLLLTKRVKLKQIYGKIFDTYALASRKITPWIQLELIVIRLEKTLKKKNVSNFAAVTKIATVMESMASKTPI